MNAIHVISAHKSEIYGKERVLLSLLIEQNKLYRNGLGILTDPPTVFVMDSPAFVEECNSLGINAITTIPKTLFDELNFRKPDVIHTHDYKSGILVNLWKFSKNKNVPVIRTLHGYTSKGKKIFSKIRAYEILDKIMLRFNNVNVGVSSEMKGVDTIINNGIAGCTRNPDFKPREDIKKFCDGTEFVIGCFARLSAEKNIVNLVESMTYLDMEDDNDNPLIKLIIFGDGPQKLLIEDMIKTHNLEDRVMLAGYDTNASQYLFEYINVYIQPSLTEGTPIAVLEAMSIKIPLILSDVGGMKPIIATGAAIRCGIEPIDITRSVIRLKSMKPSVLQDLSKNESNLFDQKYSAKSMASEYVELYYSVS